MLVSRLSRLMNSKFQGTKGFYAQVFDVTSLSENQAFDDRFGTALLGLLGPTELRRQATLVLTEPDGFMGYPGKAQAHASTCFVHSGDSGRFLDMSRLLEISRG